jgi:hypothetical protein
MRIISKNRVLLGVIFAAGLFVPACGGCLDSLNSTINTHATNVEDILNGAIQDVTAHSANWQTIVQGALDKLPAAETQVKQDMENLIQRGIANAGLEIRCDISFLGDMVVTGLKAILAKVLKQPPPLQPAVVCDASPPAIDMNLAPNARNQVEVFGYNLDQTDLKLFHVRTSNELDVTSHFALLSPFKRVIDLGATGVILDAQSVKLRIQISGGVNREIAILQKFPTPCAVRDFQTNSSQMQVIPTKVGQGDNDYDGHGPCVTATASVSLSGSTQISQTLTVHMWECPNDMTKIQSDFTEARGTRSQILFTSASDEVITKINPPTSSSLSWISTNHNLVNIADSGLLTGWDVQGDTDGDDIGRSFVRANFKSIHIVLRKNKDCVPQASLATMIRDNQLSAPAVQFLTSEHPKVLEMSRALPAKQAPRE